MIRKLMKPALGGVALLAGSAMAWAQEVSPPVVEAVVEAAPAMPESGDTAWMMVSTIMVLMMIIPGVALLYGGMVR